MRGFWDLNLIHLLNFYLGLMFMASVYMRFSQYRAIIGLVREVPGRWPKLFALIRQHGHIFVTWSTVMPAFMALALFGLNMFASYVLWPQVNQEGMTVARLVEHWLALPIVLLLGLAMLGIDCYATFTVGEVDRKVTSEYFDQAEYWLASWAAPVVHIFTLGHVNPRQMVRIEVRKALLDASKLINSSLWWVVVQTGTRVAFGLSLWFTYGWSKI